MKDKNKKVYVDYSPCRWGIGVGFFLIVGAIIMCFIGARNDIEIVSAIFVAEGIVIAIIGIILICFFDVKHNELKLQENNYLQNREILILLQNLSNGQTGNVGSFTEGVSVSAYANNEELPPL